MGEAEVEVEMGMALETATGTESGGGSGQNRLQVEFKLLCGQLRGFKAPTQALQRGRVQDISSGMSLPVLTRPAQA
uniref:HDC15114 n=1 Tax=Drosophila melanogaster TaxID=7227 RepID=Q6IJD4_DROME|nr:TPA_inf: HDC15114 [Drosophila melanogaster]